MQDFKIQRPESGGKPKPKSPPERIDSTDHTAYYAPRKRPAQQREQAYNSNRSSDEGPMVVYVLYIISLLVLVTSVAGLVYAYRSRAESNDVDRSHYTYQIRMFWIGLLLLVVGIIGIPFVIGWAVLVGWGVWILYALTKGVLRYRKGQPMG